MSKDHVYNFPEYCVYLHIPRADLGPERGGRPHPSHPLVWKKGEGGKKKKAEKERGEKGFLIWSLCVD